MIKPRTILWIIVFVLWVAPGAYALNGRQIYEKVHELRSKMLDQKTEATMMLFDRGGSKRTRTLTSYGKNASPEAYKALLVFHSPADLKGVGFLVHARTFAERDLWAYFPEYRRVRRIPTSAQDDSFFGSDFSYDDFSGPPSLDDFSFDILREETVDNRACYVVEVTPKRPRKYDRYVAWVVKNLWVTAKIEYYREKELYRAGTFSDIRIVDGIPTPFSLEMKNLKTGHKTVLTVDSMTYRPRFPDNLFTHRALERGGK